MDGGAYTVLWDWLFHQKTVKASKPKVTGSLQQRKITKQKCTWGWQNDWCMEKSTRIHFSQQNLADMLLKWYICNKLGKAFSSQCTPELWNHCSKTLDTHNAQKITKFLNDRPTAGYLKHKCLGSTFRAKEAPKPLIKGPNHGKELLHILHAFLTFFFLSMFTSCLWKEYETKWTLGLTGTCLAVCSHEIEENMPNTRWRQTNQQAQNVCRH